jgi:hypothetical protein
MEIMNISEPSPISFSTSNTSFDPIEVEGTFGVSSQKLRIDNATGSEVELSVALDVSDFAEDAKWLDGEKSFLAYSTDGSTGGLLVDPENIVLTDDDCGGVSNDRTSSRFTYIDSETNVMSIDVLNTSGGSANVVNSYARNEVNGTEDYVGGFLGSLNGDHLHYVYSVNSVLVGSSNVGGLIGGPDEWGPPSLTHIGIRMFQVC